MIQVCRSRGCAPLHEYELEWKVRDPIVFFRSSLVGSPYIGGWTRTFAENTIHRDIIFIIGGDPREDAFESHDFIKLFSLNNRVTLIKGNIFIDTMHELLSDSSLKRERFRPIERERFRRIRPKAFSIDRKRKSISLIQKSCDWRGNEKKFYLRADGVGHTVETKKKIIAKTFRTIDIELSPLA